MLSEIIKVSSGFQTSVNIAYDLKNESKIRNFIPTNSSIDLIYDLLSGTQSESTQRAKILSGAYGRGKSHIVLVALSLLSEVKDKELYRRILDKMKSYNEDIYKTVLNILDSKLKLLPVVISGSNSSLTQSFMNALQQSLNYFGLESIMPDSHFQAAVNAIENWKNNYPDTYDAFEEKVNDVDEFIKNLENNNTETYQNFITLYPSLTAGSVFNPFVGFDVVNIYENVSAAVKEHGYSGLYIVYDEFGKYLETSITTATESDTKLLQDFAEKCTRSGNNQMHLLLICHKDISNYIDMNLPQDKVDGWRGISARFEHINLQNNFSQMYEVMSAAIEKNKDKWESFCDKNKKIFKEITDRYSNNSVLSNQPDVEGIVKGCYPLHPSTVFILPRLSEKVAQNERTLFTFLSAGQKNTLVDFIEKNDKDFPFVTPDYLYNYFEMQFKKELNSSEIYKTYSLASNVLKKVEKNSLHAKIIKTIALVYMIEQFEKMPPTVDFIKDTFIDVVKDPKEITDAINDLISNSCIVYLKRSNNYLKLKKTSGVNTEDQIRERVEQLKLQTTVKAILNNASFDSYIYPVRYNDEHCITRYFEFEFTGFDEIKDSYYNADPDASGLVQAVFFENADDFEKHKNEKVNLNCAQAVVIIPKNYNNVNSVAYEFMAVSQLRDESIEDDVLFDEYNLYLEDLEEIMHNFISDYVQPEKKKSYYYDSTGELNISRKAHLSNRLSEICEQVYSKTPLINNESLNKNILPTMAINSRTKLISALLENDMVEENLGLTGTGQDVSFMRSSLMQTGLFFENEGNWSLTLEPKDENMKDMLSVISDFFNGTAKKGESSFEVLYNKLTLPENHIGLKRGVIPVYIALVLHFIKKDIVIRYKSSETKINAATLNSINETPELYSVIMENWDNDKTDYLKKLEEVFAEFIVEKEKSYNGFTYIAAAMNRWYMSLPRCSKEMKRIYGSDKNFPKEYTKFMLTLKQPSDNNRNYLIEDLPKVFGLKAVSKELADKISEVKEIFDKSRSNLKNEIIDETKKLFGGKKEASLTSTLKDWYETLKTETLQYQFPNNENKIISVIGNVDNNENKYIETFGKLIVGLRIDDWNAEGLEKYKTEFQQFIDTVEDYNSKDHSSSENAKESCKFTFYDDNGEEVVRVFDKVEYSSRAKLLYNDITSAIDEMGQSITEQEKRQVLVEILEKMFR